MARHQVIIVCGETGSGKTTQLPKMALALGRGKLNTAPGQRPRLIGHTQPRRIAATSVAKRIAEELHTPLGEVVGYKVRFNDRLSRDASVKLMTDGILLAETQGDPLLQAYDTLIIDEAHERSLNIDFLLGYLRQILPRRPDLKIIVTSATIDADRFARHFASEAGPAPVIMVSGRTYPVEQRWRPFEESRDYGLDQAIADAVDELWRDPREQGDILVFLPGEREIREAADHLRQHLSHQPALRGTDVLPLFARLSQAEQERVFDSHAGRRIVLATNVAETSLTVPGIRYVIDSGTARVKRYSYRSKVEQLLVEPISQAAAQQRSGRCGRVANGICIRLYDEQDFTARPRFTDPEILRSSLAGVILRMKSLHLGDVERFPFVEAPRPKAISDGYQLLAELGAVDEQNELTAVGRDLAHWPLDPRVGRMVLEARHRQALAEVLIVASALSVQDVRDRPLAQQTQADQAQAQFKDERSEFSGYLTLWAWLERQRGGGAHGSVLAVEGQATPTHKLSNRQFEQLLRQHFINPRRLREWRDVYSQLLTVVNQQGWHLNTQPASYEQLHCSMLAGLLGNIGWRQEDEEGYLGARGIRFYRHPGAQLRKKPGRWVVCAELVETTRLFGRGVANIEPRWLEEVGAHLLRKQVLDPKWDRRHAEVQGMERATLYGLVVYSGRRVPYARVDLAGAREIFIREALVEGQWESELPFLAANRKQIRKVMDLEHKSRRQDVLVDEALIYAFYDQQLPQDVCNGKTLERWYRQASRDAAPGQPAPLTITQAELMRHEAAGVTTEAFPKIVRLGGVDCAAHYLHEPGDPRDGLTITVPLFVLNQVNEERTEWLVPGMLKEKIQALLKSLPQKPRARLVPLPESAARLADALCVADVFANGSLYDALQARVKSLVQLDIRRTDFKADMVSPHLFMNIRVVDEHGRQLAQGRNLGALKSQWGSQARGAFQALAALRTTPVTPGQETTSAVQPASMPTHRASGQALQSPTPQRNADTSRSDATRDDTAKTSASSAPQAEQRYTSWTFGELPELMEIRKGSQTLVGFPALVDQQDAVTIEVFDEPDLAAQRHRGGLRRLFALHIRDALKYLEKNIPGLQAMVMAYLQVGKRADGTGGGSADELLSQLIEVAMDRAFLMEPLPQDDATFHQRLQEGRGRLNLIAQEVARLCGTLLTEFAQVQRKLRDTKGQPEVVEDMQLQLQRLVGKRFLVDTPYAQLQHFARYLKAMQLRLDKLRADPARDATKRAEFKPLDQRYWRLVAERKGVMDERSREYRWLLEELRVSFFAQELRTPQPVSVKRLDKAWALLVQ